MRRVYRLLGDLQIACGGDELSNCALIPAESSARYVDQQYAWGYRTARCS